jgi:hypothetical protein
MAPVKFVEMFCRGTEIDGRESITLPTLSIVQTYLKRQF